MPADLFWNNCMNFEFHCNVCYVCVVTLVSVIIEMSTFFRLSMWMIFEVQCDYFKIVNIALMYCLAISQTYSDQYYDIDQNMCCMFTIISADISSISKLINNCIKCFHQKSSFLRGRLWMISDYLNKNIFSLCYYYLKGRREGRLANMDLSITSTAPH